MFKSIRWTLQGWYATLLALALIGFGSAAHFAISQSRYANVDAELTRAIQTLAMGIRPSDIFAPEFMRDVGLALSSGKKDRPTTSPAGLPTTTQTGQRWPIPASLEIDPPAWLSKNSSTSEYVYGIWNNDRKLLAESRGFRHANPPAATTQSYGSPPNPIDMQFHQDGDLREVSVNGPFGTYVILGRSIENERAELRHLALLMWAVGGGLLLACLGGGWLISSRVLRPIATITQVAQTISATHLSRRIDVASTKSELGQLAVVLNDTFDRMEEAFTRQVRFTADASHELRTPLSVIHTNVQLALSRERTPAEYRELFEVCQRASERMKGLVDSLLQLAKADAGPHALVRDMFDLQYLVEDSVEMVMPLAAKKGIKIETRLQSAMLNADRAQVAQVIINLLTNAVRYNRLNGTVSVSVSPGDMTSDLIISDTGVGISPEHHAHLFERFYRIDAVRTREDGGSGLGLAICKSIVDAHGGLITIDSEPGRGTVVTVIWPTELVGPAATSAKPSLSAF